MSPRKKHPTTPELPPERTQRTVHTEMDDMLELLKYDRQRNATDATGKSDPFAHLSVEEMDALYRKKLL